VGRPALLGRALALGGGRDLASKQRGRFDAEGRWLLELPYADPRELVMDILRHVPEVEVLWPEELLDEVVRRLRDGLRSLGNLDE
jgi:predicted DNA-binding transcriptional regulator YafY